MGTRIGIIAGSGKYPFFILEQAQRRGYTCVVAGIKGETESALEGVSAVFEWFDVDGILEIIPFFKQASVKEIFLAGKIDPRLIFKKKDFGAFSQVLLTQVQDKSPTTLIKAAINLIEASGIKVKDPFEFLSDAFCGEGLLTEKEPSPEAFADIDFGWNAAKKLADSDIGQTVIIKDQVVVALEGIEGTDAVIERGGKLAGEGICCIKVSRSKQDARIDLPAVGLSTVKSLVDAGGKTLCIEAEKIPFFQKEESLKLANANGISIIAKKG
jgi:DUF1009 family protein